MTRQDRPRDLEPPARNLLVGLFDAVAAAEHAVEHLVICGVAADSIGVEVAGMADGSIASSLPPGARIAPDTILVTVEFADTAQRAHFAQQMRDADAVRIFTLGEDPSIRCR